MLARVGRENSDAIGGPDAKATYATCLQLGDEAFRKAIKRF
jgi:hypothetical protein